MITTNQYISHKTCHLRNKIASVIRQYEEYSLFLLFVFSYHASCDIVILIPTFVESDHTLTLLTENVQKTLVWREEICCDLMSAFTLS